MRSSHPTPKLAPATSWVERALAPAGRPRPADGAAVARLRSGPAVTLRAYLRARVF